MTSLVFNRFRPLPEFLRTLGPILAIVSLVLFAGTLPATARQATDDNPVSVKEGV